MEVIDSKSMKFIVSERLIVELKIWSVRLGISNAKFLFKKYMQLYKEI